MGKNKILGSDLLSVYCVSKINLSNNREDETRQCFSYTNVEFYYSNNIEDLNLIIETFQKETYGVDEKTNDNNNCNILGENKKIDKLIVMDGVSGLADKSNDFANFLTVSRKFGYICISSTFDFISGKHFQHFPLHNSIRQHAKHFNKQLR